MRHRIEWSFTSDDIAALLYQIAGIEQGVHVLDAEFDELADTVVIGLEVEREDFDKLESASMDFGEYQQ